MKLNNVIVLIFSLVLVSCGLPPMNNAEMSRIQVTTQKGFGKGSITTVVKYIDDEWVDSGNEFKEVAPGNHKILFDYEKTVESASGFTFSVAFFGEEKYIHSPHGPSLLTSNSPIPVSGYFEKGKTYAVDASEINNEDINADSVGFMPGIIGSRGGFEIKGKPSIRKID